MNHAALPVLTDVHKTAEGFRLFTFDPDGSLGSHDVPRKAWMQVSTPIYPDDRIADVFELVASLRRSIDEPYDSSNYLRVLVPFSNTGIALLAKLGKR